MKWLLTRSDAKQQVHELWNGDGKVLRIDFHQSSGTIRINGNGELEKRVFLVGKEGFLKNRMVLRNEYGIKVASLMYDNQGNTGTIEADNTKFFFSIDKKSQTNLLIYKESGEPVINCQLPEASGLATPRYDHLILSSYWFAIVSAETKQMLEFA